MQKGETIDEYSFILSQCLNISVLDNNIKFQFNNVVNMIKNLDYLIFLLKEDLAFYLSLIKSILRQDKINKIETKDRSFYLILFLIIEILAKNDSDFAKKLPYSDVKNTAFIAAFLACEHSNYFYKYFLSFINNIKTFLIDLDNYNIFDDLRSNRIFISKDDKALSLQIYNNMQDNMPLLLCACEYDAKHNLSLIDSTKIEDYINKIKEILNIRTPFFDSCLSLTQFYCNHKYIIHKAIPILDNVITRKENLAPVYLHNELYSIQKVKRNAPILFMQNYLMLPIYSQKLKVNTPYNVSLLNFDKKDIVLNKEHYTNTLLISLMFYVIPLGSSKDFFFSNFYTKLLDILKLCNAQDIDNLYNKFIHMYFDLFKDFYRLDFYKLKDTDYVDILNLHFEIFFNIFLENEKREDALNNYFAVIKDLLLAISNMTDYMLNLYKDKKIDLSLLSIFYTSANNMILACQMYAKKILKTKIEKQGFRDIVVFINNSLSDLNKKKDFNLKSLNKDDYVIDEDQNKSSYQLEFKRYETDEEILILNKELDLIAEKRNKSSS